MKSLERQKRIFIVVSLLAPMLLLVAFIMVPAVDLFRMSMTDWDGYSKVYGDNISEKRGKGRDWRGQVWKRPDFRRVCGGTAPEQGRDVAVILRKTASAAVGAFFAPRKAPGGPTNGAAGNDAQTYESPQNGASRPFLGACGIK